MKANKTQVILIMLDFLLCKGEFTKEVILGKAPISDLRFKRYVQELRAYLYNFRNQEDIIYDRASKKYRLSPL